MGYFVKCQIDENSFRGVRVECFCAPLYNRRVSCYNDTIYAAWVLSDLLLGWEDSQRGMTKEASKDVRV